MPVRGTTAWEHAILQKKAINFDRGGTYVMCAWDTCERDGYEMHKCVQHMNAPGYPDQTLTFIFCSERHKQFWINSLRDLNNLPPGYRRSIL